MPPTVIMTERLEVTLRPLMPEDTDALFALVEREREYLSRYEDDVDEAYSTKDAVRKDIEKLSRSGHLQFGIWDVDTLVGVITLARPSITLIRFWTAAEVSQQDHAVPAMKALCAHAITRLGIRRDELYAIVHVENMTDRRVLRACGFSFSNERDNPGGTLTYVYGERSPFLYPQDPDGPLPPSMRPVAVRAKGIGKRELARALRASRA